MLTKVIDLLAEKRPITREELSDWSLEELTELRDGLLKECESIQLQLGHPNKEGEDGERLTGPEYWRWQHAAKAALMYRRSNHRLVKALVHEARLRRVLPQAGPPNLATTADESTAVLLWEAWQFLKTLDYQKRVTYSADEWAFLSELRDHLTAAHAQAVGL